MQWLWECCGALYFNKYLWVLRGSLLQQIFVWLLRGSLLQQIFVWVLRGSLLQQIFVWVLRGSLLQQIFVRVLRGLSTSTDICVRVAGLSIFNRNLCECCRALYFNRYLCKCCGASKMFSAPPRLHSDCVSVAGLSTWKDICVRVAELPIRCSLDYLYRPDNKGNWSLWEHRRMNLYGCAAWTDFTSSTSSSRLSIETVPYRFKIFS
jgi:hypothetical protein